MTSPKDKLWVFYIIDQMSEKFGEIDGVTKLEKLIFLCNKRLHGKSRSLQSIEFERGFYGPRDPGGSYDLETNLMLGLYEIDDKDSAIRLKVTEKWMGFVHGIKGILSLEPDYEQTKDGIDEELKISGEKTLSQILQDERVKTAKEKFWKEKV
ncbi:MAG: hypothetical protein GQ567_01345 [Methanosarcinales archaeon]|jgi:hypothetical protein|nr:hypothetical protein [Methanosarcinales archaeon]